MNKFLTANQGNYNTAGLREPPADLQFLASLLLTEKAPKKPSFLRSTINKIRKWINKS